VHPAGSAGSAERRTAPSLPLLSAHLYDHHVIRTPGAHLCRASLGASLLVNPAAALAGLAKGRGAALIVITLGKTSYDELADVVIQLLALES